MKQTFLFLSVIVVIGVLPLRAAEITGTVQEVSDGTATVESQGGMPAAGDGAEFFFKLPGIDEEISVGVGTVVSREGTKVKVKIGHATGEVAKDQLVRFTPGKGTASTTTSSATATPTPAVSETPVAAATPRSFLGVNLANPTTDTSGAAVVDVRTDGPAARAGIEANDVIVALDGAPVADAAALQAELRRLAPGTRHALLISRAGKMKKIDVTVEVWPEGLTETAAVPAPEASPTQTFPPSVPFPTPTPSSKTAAAPAADLPPAAVELIQKGAAQYSVGNFDGAIASYTSAIAIAPRSGVAYLNRGNAYLYKANFKAALADANKALELTVAKMDDVYTVRGTAKAGLGDYNGANADCNRALKINPKNALAYNNRANNNLRLRNYSGALADCNKSIALDPKVALPYYNRGFARTNLGDQAGALADWQKAVAMQPSFGAELNPKIAQLQALGIRPKSTAK